MKIVDFIKEVEKVSKYFKVLDEEYAVRVVMEVTGQTYATVWKSDVNIMELNTSSVELIRLCMELAETPVEEREAVKKYNVILQDKDGEVFMLRKTENDIRIDMATEPYVNRESESWVLTEQEIKENHEYLWPLRKEVQA